jgi:D-alanyl-lipoteichoic acid acyltransferase DltB (MBOAT superfamily)
MLFHTYHYLAFLLVTCIVCRVLPPRFQPCLIVLASCLFNRSALLWIATLAATTYGAGLAIARTRAAGRRVYARWWMIVGTAFSLAPLAFYRIALPAHLIRHSYRFAVPLGVAYVTLQAIGYLADVHGGKSEATKNPLEHAAFISFFPCAVGGPILRAQPFLAQLRTRRRPGTIDWSNGAWLLFVGLFKKLYVADNLLDPVLAPPVTSLDVYLRLLMTAIGTYADLAGYADMARGSARLLGLEVPVNFDHPFFATTPEAFWRRWHITLTGWFRDYVEAPLARGLGRIFPRGVGDAVAVGTSMVLLGLWHGTSLQFVSWGAVWALAIWVDRWIRPRLKSPSSGGPPLASWLRIAGAILVFHLFAFTLPQGSSSQLISLLETGLRNVGFSINSQRYALSLLVFAAPLAALDLGQLLTREENPIARWSVGWRSLAYTGLLGLLVAGGLRMGGGVRFVTTGISRASASKFEPGRLPGPAERR